MVASRYAETPVYRITSSGPVSASGGAKESLPAFPVAAKTAVKPKEKADLKGDTKMDVRLHPKWKPTPLGF